MKKRGIMPVVMLLVFLFSQTVFAETYEYDALNWVTKVIYDDGSYVTYEYDAAGNMISTQVTEPETSEPEEKPGQENTWGTVLEELLEAVGTQIAATVQAVAKVVEQLVQEFLPVISSLFGWLFG